MQKQAREVLSLNDAAEGNLQSEIEYSGENCVIIPEVDNSLTTEQPP